MGKIKWRPFLIFIKLNCLPKIQCDNFKKNRAYVQSSQGTWLKDKMLSIRYEDLCLFPSESIRKIYQFIGRESNIGDLLTKFKDLTIEHSTNEVKSRKRSDYAWMYNTNKDSRKTAFKWRWDIEMNEYEEVQNSCGEKLFNDFGYQWLNTSQELDNAREKTLGQTYADRYNSEKFWPLDEQFKFADTAGSEFLRVLADQAVLEPTNFRNISDEAHHTTKFLDRRRFEISKYVRVY